MKMILLGIEIISIIFYWVTLIGVVVEREKRKKSEEKQRANIMYRIAVFMFAMILSLIPIFNVMLGIIWIADESKERGVL